jgi:hypothetical protein
MAVIPLQKLQFHDRGIAFSIKSILSEKVERRVPGDAQLGKE